MRPPFILDTYRGPLFHDKNRRIIVTKNVYDPAVKNHDWQGNLESWPYDNEVENCRISHYKTLGRDCFCYATTGDMLKQIKSGGRYVQGKPIQKITSYFSFRDSNATKETEPAPMYPATCSADYRSIMQKDYTPPYPTLPRARSTQKENFLQNRRMKQEDPMNAKYQFWDEDLPEIMKRMQCKGRSHKSYDFCRGAYTDGSLPVEKKH